MLDLFDEILEGHKERDPNFRARISAIDEDPKERTAKYERGRVGIETMTVSKDFNLKVIYQVNDNGELHENSGNFGTCWNLPKSPKYSEKGSQILAISFSAISSTNFTYAPTSRPLLCAAMTGCWLPLQYLQISSSHRLTSF